MPEHIRSVLARLIEEHPSAIVAANRALLVSMGVREDIAEGLAKQYDAERIKAVIDYCAPRYGPGGIVKALVQEWQLPSELFMSQEDPRYPSDNDTALRPGFIYFMAAASDLERLETGERIPIKIGRTINPVQRLRNFNGTSDRFTFVATVPIREDHHREEMRAHGLAAHQWIEREWFDMTSSEIDDVIKELKGDA